MAWTQSGENHGELIGNPDGGDLWSTQKLSLCKPRFTLHHAIPAGGFGGLLLAES
jgi:hypothetical protein